jgi:hypothetical protein
MNAGEITIAVNKEYLDTALMCFEDSKFSMSVCSPVSPILLENNQMSILILPLRIIED